MGVLMLRILRNLFSRPPSPGVIEAREELYARYFEATPQINHSTNKVFPHVDVYHFEPTETRPFHTLITGGMAEYRQPVGDPVPKRLELMIYTQTFQYWALNLLKILAEYPAQNETYFAPRHTIPIGYRLSETSEISAFLLATPENEELTKLSFDLDGDPVEYLLVIPITMIEHAYAREVDTEDLYRRLKEVNLLIHADDERRSVLEYTPKETE
jgi:hypothetical protein